MRLSANFVLSEFEVTDTDLPNDVPSRYIKRIQRLVDRVLQPLRTAVGQPVHINSGYRSPKVNRAVGGSSTSQHMVGEAADITVSHMDSQELADAIDRLNRSYDQLIRYAPERGGHVHVSLRARGNRQQRLYAPTAGGYIVDHQEP